MQIKDINNIKYKFPEKTCKECKKYPCMINMDIFKCDFAKYGCKDYT